MPEYLEYRNSNLQTRYPFAYSNSANATFPIQNDWFADIVFYRFDSLTNGVFISNILVNTTDNVLVLTFSDTTTSNILITTTTPFSAVVDMSNVVNPSFLGYSNSTCAVKIVYGPGLISTFTLFRNVTYSSTESKLASNAVILNVPAITSLSFLQNYPSSTIKTYNSSTPNVMMQFDANTTADLTDVNQMSIDVTSGSGTGLFNPCSPVFPTTNLVSINNVLPDINGNVYLVPDSCYSISLLTENDITELGDQIASYDPFSIPTQSPNIFDALIPGKSFLITNNCSPKCPPEALNAFAYYINRVRNGVQELFEFVDSPDGEQTIGTCDTDTTSNTLTALAFTRTYPGQTGFIKYYHEGKTITLVYSDISSETRTIVEVVDVNNVILDSNFLTTASGITFDVNDLGFFQQLNDAIIAYNTRAALINSPNGRVDYTTSESEDLFGEFGTFVSVVVTIFNPTFNTITFDIGAPLSGDISAIAGSEKIRVNNTILYGVSTGTLPCKSYATWENLYFIPCGENSGTIDVATTWTFDSVTTTLLGGSESINVTSTQCAPEVTSDQFVTVAAGGAFCYQVTATNAANQVAFVATSLPSWATTNTAIPVSCNMSGTITDTTDTKYAIEMTVSNASGGYSPFTLYLTVVAVPTVTSDSQTVSLLQPWLYQIIATGFPTSYGATGLPPGLTLNASNGIITGTPSALGVTTVPISATNTAGTGTGTLTITVTETAPTITSSSTWSTAQGLAAYYQIVATPNPTSYTCGTLPAGLSFNSTYGYIFGYPTMPGISSTVITATNAVGSTGPFTLAITITPSAPVITSSLNPAGLVNTPFHYSITATNSPTSYGAALLPTGLTISGSTISGTVTSPIVSSGSTISATNGVGTTTQPITFTFS